MTWQELRRRLLEAFADEDWDRFVSILNEHGHKLTLFEALKLRRSMLIEFRHEEIVKRLA